MTEFTEGISHISSCAGRRGRTLDAAAYLELSKAFDTVSVGEI